MRPEDVYELTEVADPRLSPDGSTVAFVVWKVDRDANDYRSAIWAVPLDGSAPPRRVTAGEKQDADPRWSPDGRFLAFTSDRGGKRTKKQLYVMPVGEPGEPRRLTELDEEVEDPATRRVGDGRPQLVVDAGPHRADGVAPAANS